MEHWALYIVMIIVLCVFGFFCNRLNVVHLGGLDKNAVVFYRDTEQVR